MVPSYSHVASHKSIRHSLDLYNPGHAFSWNQELQEGTRNSEQIAKGQWNHRISSPSSRGHGGMWRDSLLQTKVTEGCRVVSFSPVLSVEGSTNSWETIGSCSLTQTTLFSFISWASNLLWGSGSWQQKARVRQAGKGRGWGGLQAGLLGLLAFLLWTGSPLRSTCPPAWGLRQAGWGAGSPHALSLFLVKARG